ncbi:MAG: metallophosphoesterase [Chloroflexi bacterium]|nr:metallophosphoesterase [Chloroflexota bacterium]MCI0580556.1 metallophosphoesterase [Chloroflexota bacterium]MCI0644936.1 metallophosphoesterase [Chloroflexota bacterium]MCI0731159.1 metallophosphoesterase [Chloroflexota bacterium]
MSDLHGDWDAYRRYRDRFVALQARGEADWLILAGDLIHADSPADPDDSLEMVTNVLALQATYGEAIIYLCGNHELPHIYGFSLSKGETEYTPGFEATLSQSGRRAEIMGLFDGLPFFVRTAGGASITHAGASRAATTKREALKLFRWNHQEQLSIAEGLLAEEDVPGLRRAYARLSQVESYEALARRYLAVTGPDDPRYDDLLRGMFVMMIPGFDLLWEALFTTCERNEGEEAYEATLIQMLAYLSEGFDEQRVLVAGHMKTPGGHQVVAGRHLRLASAAHARPREAGLYLLFDVARPVYQAADLQTNLFSVYQLVD